MNKKIFILLIVFFGGAIGCYSHKKKSHHNLVYFTGDTVSVSFNITDHCITSGQPFTNSVVTATGNPPGLDIEAGRHNSKNTACCLSKTGFKDMNFTFYRKPSALNFAVIGTLIINGVNFKDIVLAQGRNGAANNWWFGGKKCGPPNNSMSNIVNCTSDDGKKTWCFMRGDINATADGNGLGSTGVNEVYVLTRKCIPRIHKNHHLL